MDLTNTPEPDKNRDLQQPERDGKRLVDNLSFGVLIQIAGRLATNEVEKLAQPAGLAAGHLVLLGMVERQPDMVLQQYSAILEINDSTLSRYAEKLVNLGYVERYRSSEDGRAVKMAVTEAGRRVVDEARDYFEPIKARYEAALGADDLETLTDILRRLVESQGTATRSSAG